MRIGAFHFAKSIESLESLESHNRLKLLTTMNPLEDSFAVLRFCDLTKIGISKCSFAYSNILTVLPIVMLPRFENAFEFNPFLLPSNFILSICKLPLLTSAPPLVNA